MELNEKQQKEIEKAINEKKCLKDFECYRSGFVKICKAKDVGLKNFVECLEEESEQCEFSFSIGGPKHFCDCAVRVYVAKELDMQTIAFRD